MEYFNLFLNITSIFAHLAKRHPGDADIFLDSLYDKTEFNSYTSTNSHYPYIDAI